MNTDHQLEVDLSDARRTLPSFVSLYNNSLAGPLSAMAAIYDTMQYIRPPIHTLRRAIR
jgi:ATP-dependent protease ClpP protease subunit